MKLVLAALALAACTPLPPTHPRSVDDGIEVRLGCTIITRREVDGALAAAERSGRRARREEVRDELLRLAVKARLAESRAVTVDPSELDRALVTVASQNGLTVDELWTAIDERGIDREAYLAGLRAQIFEYRFASAIAGPIRQTEIEAERERRNEAGDPIDEVGAREAVQERMIREAVDHEIARLRRVRVLGAPSGCIEVLN